ncbi:MAG: hypothetical protein WBB48_13615 [Thermodesulfobacteriota bacterium]
MRKLILAGALVVGLSIPAVSQAEVNAFGVQLPVQSSEVSDNIRGGYVASSSADTLVVQSLQSEKVSAGNHVASSAADSFVVQKLRNS